MTDICCSQGFMIFSNRHQWVNYGGYYGMICIGACAKLCESAETSTQADYDPAFWVP